MEPMTEPRETVPGRPAPFRPAPGLANPHAQTVGGKLLRPRDGLPLRRERVELPDGDFVDLDAPADDVVAYRRAGLPGPAAADAPLVLVLHGLEGSARRRYMMTTYRALLGRGLRPVGLNFRGCSGEPNRAARAYHSGDTEDLRHVVALLRQRTDRPMGLIGYSLGGNVVLKFLGEEGEDAADGIGAAAAVSVPFDLSAGSDRIEKGVMGRLYTWYFMRNLQRKIAGKRELLGEVCEPEAALAARTLREFDDAATAPMHGFRDAEDYYRRSSSAGFIGGIGVPTLVVHSRDDPFLPPEYIPEAAMAANPNVTPVLTDRGGHVGFIEGSLLRPRFWAEPTLAAFLAERLGAATVDEEAGSR